MKWSLNEFIAKLRSFTASQRKLCVLAQEEVCCTSIPDPYNSRCLGKVTGFGRLEMFRKFTGAVLVTSLLASFAFAQDQKEKPWFDMENCDICKHMVDHQHLMLKVKWATYKIDNGFMSISVVPEDLRDEMDQVKDAMNKAISKVVAGEQLEMCQHCTGYGTLMAAGATLQELDTVGGEVGLFTSSDADVVRQLHEFADKTEAAHKKMQAEMHQHTHEHGDHEDGDHEHDDGKKEDG